MVCQPESEWKSSCAMGSQSLTAVWDLPRPAPGSVDEAENTSPFRLLDLGYSYLHCAVVFIPGPFINGATSEAVTQIVRRLIGVNALATGNGVALRGANKSGAICGPIYRGPKAEI